MTGNKTTPQQEIMRLLQKAGYSGPTPLQQKVFPAFLAGKDVAIEAGSGTGRTAAFVLPLLAVARRERHGLFAMVLTSDAERVKSISAEFARFSRGTPNPPTAVCLGDLEDARKELRRLEKTPDIVVGTTERVIDHIRRGNLPFADVRILVVDQPEEDGRDDFDKDVPFILAKISPDRQIVLLCARISREHNAVFSMLKRPQTASAADLSDPAAGLEEWTAGFSWFETSAREREALLKLLLPMRGVTAALIVCRTHTGGETLARSIGGAKLPAGSLPEGAGNLPGQKLLAEMQKRGLKLFCVPDRVLRGADLTGISHVIFYDLPEGSGEPLKKLLRESLKGKETVFLVQKGQMRKFNILQESTGVTMKKDELPSDDEVLHRLIDATLEKLAASEPEALAKVRALFRRKVPLHRRSWFAACLLQSQLAPAAPKAPARGAPRGARQEGAPRGARQEGAPRAGGRPQEKKAGFTRLFVNAGRNRRLWPKDFVALFTEKVGVSKEDLGDIKVFDKYSFVEIIDARAEAAISALNGTEFKGKPLAIDYAKKREEKPTRELR